MQLRFDFCPELNISVVRLFDFLIGLYIAGFVPKPLMKWFSLSFGLGIEISIVFIITKMIMTIPMQTAYFEYSILYIQSKKVDNFIGRSHMRVAHLRVSYYLLGKID